MKRSHKISIGVFVAITIIFIITSSVITYAVIRNQKEHYANLNDELISFKRDTQSQINALTEEIMTLTTQLGNVDQEIGTLKAIKSSDFSNIVEDSTPSILTIRTDVSQGTGFVISDNGYVITNEHVLVGARTVWGIDENQKVVDLDFIGSNSPLDIALLKANKTFNALNLGNSDSVKVGESVVAIGNPLGLQFSVSQGIISAIGREGPNGEDVYFQTDAALNPGNSGGPLIDSDGEVIGINNYKISGDNIGFALESNYIKDAVNSISEEELNQTIL